MKYLLDTCTLLWLLIDSPMLSSKARALGSEPGLSVWVSSVSTWELMVKHNLGKMPLPGDAAEFIREAISDFGYHVLPMELEATLHLSKLPPLHRDPFDRMLICQALTKSMTIVTSDQEIRRYPVLTAW